MRKLLLIALTLLTLPLMAQDIQYLSPQDVEIDKCVPRKTFSFPLPDNYSDSIYAVQLLYPEYIPMPADYVARYETVEGAGLPKQIEVETYVVCDRKKSSLEVLVNPFAEIDGKPSILSTFKLELKATAAEESGAKGQAPQAASWKNASVLANGTWVKIRVSETGIYNLSDAFLHSVGFSNPAKVHLYGYGGNLQNEKMSSLDITRTDDLKELPTCKVEGQRLFFANGTVHWTTNTATTRVRNPYSDYAYYFLTEQEEEPLYQTEEEFTNSFYPLPYSYHWLFERDGHSWFRGGRNLFDTQTITASQPMTIQLPHNPNAAKAKLTVVITSGETSSIRVQLNEHFLGEQQIKVSGEYTKAAASTSVYNITTTGENDNLTISLKSGALARLDYVQMTWEKPLEKPSLNVSYPTPEYFCNITNQDHHADQQADMVIIVPASQKLTAQAQRLADHHRQHDGLRVNVVPADELYNEFSSGTPDANAYRRYLKMFYDRATTEEDMPKFLLLFGDCMFDNRMLSPACKKLSPDDYLLCFESEDSYSKTSCYVDDGWFTLLDEGEGTNPKSMDKMDVAVGRFPVTTPAEAKVMVDKAISYATAQSAGAWQNTVFFMGDDGDNNLHMRDCNAAAEEIQSLYPDFLVKKVMWDAYNREGSSTGHTYPEVSKIIKQQQQDGALIMDYCGHGSEHQVSHETVLKLSDFENFTNKNLSLWVTASCDLMPFDGPVATIGETAVLNPKGGAVAFFGTTRTVYASYNKAINKAFLRHALALDDGKGMPIGEAARRAKNEMIELASDLTQNKLQYSLLGDPAVRLARPTMKVVIDKINDEDVNAGNTICMQAGSIATVKGHVEGAAMNGTATITVRDSREMITCLLNERADEAFRYYDRQTTLFSGNDNVTEGEFSFTFSIPRDINYSNKSGLINVFAISADDPTQVAHGISESFVVGGSVDTPNDGIPPTVYCYLNSPDFTNGDTVNPTPYFVAEVSDRDGINAAGSGIGHSMQLIIDGEMQRTYNLSSNFTYDFGSYTSGRTYYSIPQLEPGKHFLEFRVWDILNNSSFTRLDFNVDRSLTPDFLSLSCTDNPARDKTTFIIQHNRTESVLDVTLDIMDAAGRLLWQHKEQGVSKDSLYTIDWDLTAADGHRLQTGIYLYRVRLACDGSEQTSRTRKLVIIN